MDRIKHPSTALLLSLGLASTLFVGGKTVHANAAQINNQANQLHQQILLHSAHQPNQNQNTNQVQMPQKKQNPYQISTQTAQNPSASSNYDSENAPIIHETGSFLNGASKAGVHNTPASDSWTGDKLRKADLTGEYNGRVVGQTGNTWLRMVSTNASQAYSDTDGSYLDGSCPWIDASKAHMEYWPTGSRYPIPAAPYQSSDWDTGSNSNQSDNNQGQDNQQESNSDQSQSDNSSNNSDQVNTQPATTAQTQSAPLVMTGESPSGDNTQPSAGSISDPTINFSSDTINDGINDNNGLVISTPNSDNEGGAGLPDYAGQYKNSMWNQVQQSDVRNNTIPQGTHPLPSGFDTGSDGVASDRQPTFATSDDPNTNNSDNFDGWDIAGSDSASNSDNNVNTNSDNNSNVNTNNNSDATTPQSPQKQKQNHHATIHSVNRLANILPGTTYNYNGFQIKKNTVYAYQGLMSARRELNLYKLSTQNANKSIKRNGQFKIKGVYTASLDRKKTQVSLVNYRHHNYFILGNAYHHANMKINNLHKTYKHHKAHRR